MIILSSVIKLRPRLAASLRLGWFAGFGLLGLAGPVRAQTFLTLNLPNLSAPPGSLAISHLSDGRFVYGNGNALYLQTSFGSAATTSFATPPGVDPSFITVLNDTTAVVGAGGGFGPSSVYQFNPTNPASPAYSAIASLQNYLGAPASGTALYVVGANGSGTNIFDGPTSAVSYVATNGTQQIVVDNAGGFSSGVAVDGGGNLFVGDDDTSSVYKFTAAQVANAIAHATTLSFTDGTLVHTFAADVVGSIAVDAEGRLWAAGFGAPGLYWFDPSSNLGGSLDPQDGADNPSGLYAVSTFSANGNDYLSYVYQSGFGNGDQVIYGYNTLQNVPEPAVSALFAALMAGLAVMRRRR